MSAVRTILVATDSASDAELVVKLLREEFESVAASSDPERAVTDFERHRPAVLVLAFDTLEKSERYYLGLYRLSTIIHALPHRTVILCRKEDLRRVYELCRKEYYDDYILFWPATNDAPRLYMTVHRALRQLAAPPEAILSDLTTQARRLAEMEAVLDRYVSSEDRQIDIAGRSLKQAERDIGAALDRFSFRLAEGDRRGLVEIKDRVGFQQELDRMKSEEIGKRLDSVARAVAPIRDLTGALKRDLAPQIESARALTSMVEQIRPVVLVVEDDEFQVKLLAQALSNLNLDAVFTASAMQALAALRKRRPDLILMDVHLPDIDGIEATRRIKAVERFGAIPILMITGRSEKAVVEESLKAGASDFIVKPFERDILLGKLRRFLLVDARELQT
ncbi:MAG: response regulator [Burkholderiales bacterium]|nr:response regulator [Burkholderiales bacterium]